MKIFQADAYGIGQGDGTICHRPGQKKRKACDPSGCPARKSAGREDVYVTGLPQIYYFPKKNFLYKDSGSRFSVLQA